MPLVCSRRLSVLSHLVDGLVTGVLQPQVNHGVLEGSAHVELQGEVVHPLDRRTGTFSSGSVPPLSFCTVSLSSS